MSENAPADPNSLRQTQTVVDEPREDDEPTKEEILESIRRGMRDIQAGQTRPAREALADIRQRLKADAHDG